MWYLALRRSVVGGALGLLLLSGSPASAYDDYPYDSSYDDPGRDRDYDRGGADQDSYSRQSSPPPPSQPQGGYGTPFGVSKSTAGAITGALLGAGAGAIIGSHKGKAGPGAAIGAGIGGVGGYLTGRQLEAQDQALDEQQRMIDQQQQEIAKNRKILEELKRRKLDARETPRGIVVNLPDVLFEFNSHRLTAEAHDKVAHIASVLKGQAKERQVSVEGHADAIGSDAYNQVLSERRAGVVAQELSFDGVRESRLATHGFGERYPVAPNTREDGTDNPAGRAKNRRVEVVIAK